MKSLYFPSLNGLRALCIFMVISDHLLKQGFFERTPFINFLSMFLFNGPLGVQFFFVISGFLITSLMLQEDKRYGKISLKNFYLRRSFRIFPAYYFLLAVYFILDREGYFHLTRINWISNLTYTKQFFQDETVETIHLWSLSVEEFFYLFWPLLYIKFFSKLNIRYLYFLVASFAIFRFFNFSYPKSYFGNTIVSTGDALLIGCLFAINYKKVVAWVNRHNNLVWLAFPLLVVIIVLKNYAFHLVSVNDYNSFQYWLIHAVLPTFYALFGDVGLLTNLLIAIIIVYSMNARNYYYKLLNHPVLNYIGIMSYSIYLWQELFISERMHAFHLTILTTLILILLCAHISYYIIEKPFLKVKERFKTNPIQNQALGADLNGRFFWKAYAVTNRMDDQRIGKDS